VLLKKFIVYLKRIVNEKATDNNRLIFLKTKSIVLSVFLPPKNLMGFRRL